MQDKFEIEAVFGETVLKVISEGSRASSTFYGDEDFWAQVRGQIILGGTFRIAGTSRTNEVGYTPFGMLSAMSSVNGGLVFTKVPKSVSDYFSETMTSHEAEVYF